MTTNPSEFQLPRTSTHDTSSTTEDELIRVHEEILHLRDYAIGITAELGVMRARYAKAQVEVESLIEQLDMIHSSRTWRIGRFMILPLRLVRRILAEIQGA